MKTKKLNVIFSHDNGLPLKPVIAPAFSEGFLPDENKKCINIFLNKEEQDLLGDLSVDKYYLVGDEIWIGFLNFYVALSGVSPDYFSLLKRNNLNIYFYTEENQFITGYY